MSSFAHLRSIIGKLCSFEACEEAATQALQDRNCNWIRFNPSNGSTNRTNCYFDVVEMTFMGAIMKVESCVVWRNVWFLIFTSPVSNWLCFSWIVRTCVKDDLNVSEACDSSASWIKTSPSQELFNLVKWCEVWIPGVLDMICKVEHCTADLMCLVKHTPSSFLFP